MDTLYTPDQSSLKSEVLEKDSYGFRKCVEAVADNVPVSRYIADYNITELKPSGLQQVALCPFHEERTPSFTVFGDKSYYCFGCQQSGDVVSLHFHLSDCNMMWEAMLELANEYNVRLPERPKRWHDWQNTKADRRYDIRTVKARLYQRRIFHWWFQDAISAIEDPDEREREAQQVWRELWLLAWRWAE